MAKPGTQSIWREPIEEAEDRERWRNASAREKVEALIDLLGLVDAIGRFPERRTRWPGFPKPAADRLREGS